MDAELLEFLGSIDVEDEEWREYLAERPIRPEAGKPVEAPARRRPGKEKAPAQGGEQREKVKQP